MNDFNNELWVTIFMLAFPVGVGILLVCLIVADIIDGIKFKKQMAHFKSLYEKCIEKYGLAFAQKLYDGCREPWIGMDNVIKVFEHHCGVTNN